MIENPFSWLYFPTALTLGSLHALEPGHAKALTASYLIGIKGTRRDALLLGLSVALTHSIVVITIAVSAVWLGREAFTQDITHGLKIGSSLVVICLGLWMLIKRVRLRKPPGQVHPAHHESEPIRIKTTLCVGDLEIAQTQDGERLKFRAVEIVKDASIRVLINRLNGIEILELHLSRQNSKDYLSLVAPDEPHEFSAEFEIKAGEKHETLPFAIHESDTHAHDHSLMSDDEHARAHAATIPDYAKKGERPTWQQILAFGAAGGMIPCPSSITVMLLSLSIGRVQSGVLAVAGFSIGLAITLVGIGFVVVAGLQHFKGTGRFNWVSSKAPVISAGVVVLSGFLSLFFAY